MIVENCQSPPAFFAKRLFKSMDGLGTDDLTLIRIIVSRSEIDLENIKDEFERLFDRTLLSAVKVYLIFSFYRDNVMFNVNMLDVITERNIWRL